MRRILPLAIGLIAFACTTSTTTTTPSTNNDATTRTVTQRVATTPAPATKAPLFGSHGFDLAAMDTSVNACENFYEYAVGKWKQAHPLPAQYSRYGRFEELSERNREVLHT